MSEENTNNTEAAELPPFVLEQGKRFSQSIMWKLTRDFYEQRGISAWDSGIVPSYVTSNPFIAQSYAQVVWQYVRDCLSDRFSCRIDPSPNHSRWILTAGKTKGIALDAIRCSIPSFTWAPTR